ncbi:MAG: hypothetical protein KF700_04840 [Hyphomonadaceae bacterium]|nr:hypothetical protein [Hyphomonadaceae bacterium]
MAMLRSVLAGAGALVLAGCASLGGEAPAPEPSPRAECAPATATIYFTEESATLQPLSRPILEDLVTRIRACEAAGGELRGVVVTGYPDRTAGAGAARAEMDARNARVREALVELGVPTARITTRLGRSQRGAIMQRRAEVAADLY